MIKQIFYAFFVYIEITHPQKYNIRLRFALLNTNYLGWIISDIKQKGMEYLLIINYHESNNNNKEPYIKYIRGGPEGLLQGP